VLLASLLLALGLMLVLEGLMPMLMPRLWRRLFEQMLKLEDGQIRFFGMLMVLMGLSFIWLLA
jgi:uncharacterized protein YjeT (DUF2065 family)